MLNNKKKSKKGCLWNSYSIISMDTRVKSLNEEGRYKDTVLSIGALVNVVKIMDERYAAIRVVDEMSPISELEEQTWKCPRDVLVHVDQQVWPYLEAVPSPVERVFLLKNHALLNKLTSIDIGSLVEVRESPAATCLPAIVKYKGPVSQKGPGHFFGVELLEGEGEGDGSYGGKGYFTCAKGSGMFVAISKIMIPNNIPSSNSSYSLSKHNQSSSTDMRYRREEERCVLKPGDDVVWLSDSGPREATVLGYHHSNPSSPSHMITVSFKSSGSRGDTSPSHVLAHELVRLKDFYALTDNGVESSADKSRYKNGTKSIDIVSKYPALPSHYAANDLILFDTPPKYTSPDGLSPERDEFEEGDWEQDTDTRDLDGEIRDLDEGSLVQVCYKGMSHYGVIRWVGRLPHKSSLTAGIEMEEEFEGLSDGVYNGKRYFRCNDGRAYFTNLSNCRSDSRFHNIDDNIPGPSHASVYANTSSSDYPLVESPVIRGSVAPLSREEDLGELCGKYRGIQGHHNSCYLDATLFSMFTFTSVFDSLLLRPSERDDIDEYCEVQRVLREEIVNPLRANLYVTSNRVMKLRTLLDRLSNVSGLTSEEKDPEEFLTSLVAQILRAEPFLKLSSGQDAYLYQLFLEKDESIKFPTVQQLFDQSFLASDIKLKQVPSCLIIQMPRFGKSYKMYPRILPSQVLDVTDVIQDSPRQCTVCGMLAEFECKQCFNQCDAGLQSISFCSSCLETAHSHEKRSGHSKTRLTVPSEFYEFGHKSQIPRIYMSLFAILCIETSHYVAFVKCGTGPEAPWCFFDSMADRKGEQDGYNIPEVVACPYLPEWLSERGAQTLNQIPDEKQLPELAKRLLCDAYMCIYQSTDIMMYS